MTQGRSRSRSVGNGTGGTSTSRTCVVRQAYGPPDLRPSDVQLVTADGGTGPIPPGGPSPTTAVTEPAVGPDAEARAGGEADDEVMDATRFSVLFGGLLLMGVIVLALRWTFGGDRVIPRSRLPADPDDPTGLGLLVEASRVPDPTAAEVLRGRLAGAGIRATVRRAEPTDDDPSAAGFYRILVFPD